MGKTTDNTLLTDSKSDGINFLDRNAGKILIWSMAISFILRLISLLMMSPLKEQLEVVTDEELDQEETAVLVVWAMLGGLVGWLAVLVGFIGKALALTGFIQRGYDRDRRRQAECHYDTSQADG